MRRPLALLAALALVLVGCETSNLDRSASVVVSGRVLLADGSPAAGAPVALERQPSIGDLLAGTALATITFLTACLADPPPEVCRGRRVRRATTTADGMYTFQLKGSDTQTVFGNVSTLSISAELPPGAGEAAGAAVVAAFRVQTENLRLPDLQVWQPRVTVAGGRITWEPPVAGNRGYRAVAEDRGAQLVWTFESPGQEVTFDPRILEDTTGSVGVTAQVGATAEGTSVDILRRSARVPYRSTAGVPASRGRPCTRGAAPTPIPSCPLTDGNLVDRLPDRPAATTTTTAAGATTASPPPDTATVDLGRARDVSLVVVRGCTCQVEGSVDEQA